MSYPKITEMIDFREHFRGEFQATESSYLRSTQILDKRRLTPAVT